MSDKLLTKAEAAEAMGMTEWWVDRRRSDGDLKSIKLGKYVRIPESEVLRLLSEGTQGGAGTGATKKSSGDAA